MGNLLTVLFLAWTRLFTTLNTPGYVLLLNGCVTVCTFMNKHLTVRKRQTEVRKWGSASEQGRPEAWIIPADRETKGLKHAITQLLLWICHCGFNAGFSTSVCVTRELLPLRWRAPPWKEEWMDSAPVEWWGICQRWRPGQNISERRGPIIKKRHICTSGYAPWACAPCKGVQYQKQYAPWSVGSWSANVHRVQREFFCGQINVI